MKVTTDSCLFGAWAAKKIKDSKNVQSVLDIGTGTGLLSLMLAQQNPFLKIEAVEIDTAAAEQAKQNVQTSEWRNNITVFNIDVKDHYRKYDLVICNPPFYENELLSPDKEKNIAHHSKTLNLRNVIEIVKRSLNDTGQYFLLLPFKRIQEAKKIISGEGLGIAENMQVKQTTAHPFFRVMLTGTHREQQLSEKESKAISIKDAQGNYSVQFKKLLNDYYLYL